MSVYRTPANIESPKEPQPSLRQKMAKAISAFSSKRHSGAIASLLLLVVLFLLIEGIGQIIFCFVKNNYSRLSLEGLINAARDGVLTIIVIAIVVLCSYGLYHFLICLAFLFQELGVAILNFISRKLEEKK